MIKELIKLADHLDKKGYKKEADYIDALVANAAKKKDKSKDSQSKWYKMKMSKIVEEMEKHEIDSLSFKVHDYNIRFYKVHK